MIRQPIITVVGHVDHGKTSLLDRIRRTAVTKTEAGKITQAIGASIIPLSVIRGVCGKLLEKLNLQLTIPGLLFIDTPGHAAFTNLRKRGGALADIAVLVVDINEGFMPQTLESIGILKSDKTPFVVAANKIDLVQGWQSGELFLQNFARQSQRTQEAFETKIYELVGKLHELGFASERFDRVSDHTKQVSIIPVSAQTGEGVPELLMLLAGLAQKFLEKKLHVGGGEAKGTVLEVKEEKGLGVTVDAIIYDGTLKVNDTIVIGGMDKALITKVRALLEPSPLAEMRVKKAKFKNVKEIFAASGVRIAAPALDTVVAGMPLRGAKDPDTVAKEIQQEVKEVLIATDAEGVVIKADTLGSLEAMIVLLREHAIPIKSASVGKISKKDITEAEVSSRHNPFHGVILGFNVSLLPDAEQYLQGKDVKIILHDVIYRMVDEYTRWKDEKKKAMEIAELDTLVRGGKFRLLSGYVFRQSNPSVVGVEVISGRIKSGEPVMNKEGKKLTSVKAIQEEKENVSIAEVGKQVAVSMDGVMVGRQIHEGDVLYIDVPEEDFRKMKELKHYLDKKDIALLKEIAEIKRKGNPVWGV